MVEGRRFVRGLVLSGASAVSLISGLAHAGGLPVGGSVAAGSASVASNGTTTVVTQSTPNAVINWASFSVGAGNAVRFVDPDAASATLNRVTGSAASTIAGAITSNGAVYLVNPNGIAITSTGSVQTGGGFVASTLDIADADFMAGRLNFAGTSANGGASKTVSNAGSITAGQGVYVALLGGAVSNSGSISVPYGRLGLGSGEQVALDLNGGNFMAVAVPTALVTGGALVDNPGSLSASGGSVQLAAAVVKGAVRNVINMSGSINADSATGNGGTISLIGGADTGNMAGTVTVSGSLSARATGTSGHGGSIETSGEHVNLVGSTVTTASAHGAAGSWLIDPTDFTVAASGGDETGAALSAALGLNAFVLIQSANGSGGTAGNININDAVSWSANTLTLDAYNNVNINAAMNATGTAHFVGITGDLANNGNSTGAGSLNFALGASGFTGKLNLASTGTFSLNGSAYTIITTTAGLQAINSGLTGNYVLGTSLDMAGVAGFAALGTNGTGTAQNGGNGFTGQFIGLGQTVSNLTITQPGASYLGLFGYAGSGSSISDVGVVGVSISGASYLGALVGNDVSGTIKRAYATGHVTATGTAGASTATASAPGGNGGDATAGGLAGASSGTISKSYASTIVAATGGAGGAGGYGGNGGTGGAATAGALAGANSGTIAQSYATGAVTATGGYAGAGGYTAASGGSGGGAYAGGLVGSNSAVVTQSYATGAVTATGGAGQFAGGYVNAGGTSGVVDAGGLAGLNSGAGAAISQSYASGATTGTGGHGGYGNTGGASTAADVGGLVGLNNASISQSYATGAVTGQGGIGGTSGPNPGIIGGTANAGALVGANSGGSATITQTYATGATKGTGGTGGGGGYGATTAASGAGNNGGLAGNNSATISNSYWDSYSTGLGSGVGTGTNPATLTAVTANPAQSGAANYAFNPAAYANLAAASGIGTSTPTGFVFFNGTRPFLAFEAPTPSVNGIGADGGVLISNARQLQLIGAGANTLSNTYALAGNIDLSVTSANTGTPTTSAGLWGPTGFVSLGTDGAGNVWNGSVFAAWTAGSSIGFSGNFSGNGYTISNLAIASSATNFTGLFGVTSNGTISNLTLAGSVSGVGLVGGVSGVMVSGTISGVTMLGSVTGTSSYAGGIAGAMLGGTISNATDSGSVSGANYVGGIAGDVRAAATVSSNNSTGTVTGSGYSTGGIAGRSTGTLAFDASTAVVSGLFYVGGIVGFQGGGTISGALADHNAGSVSATSASAQAVGGIVGYQAAGSVTNGASFGGVTSAGSYTGGVVGVANGTMTGTTSTGTVSGLTLTGGFAGYVGSGAALSGDTATGNTTGSGYFTGGFAGESDGTLSGDTTGGGTVTGTNYTGGLVGYLTGGAVSLSASHETVATSTSGPASQATGGLIGGQTGGTIDQSYASGAVAVNGYYVGGLIGYLHAGTDSNVHASGAVGTAGAYAAGGLVGVMDGGSIAQAYAAGAVSGTKAGGLVGALGGGTLSNAAWDSTTTGQATGVASQWAGSFTASGYTTSQLQNAGNTSLYVGFDFTNIWNAPTSSAYPTLKNAP